MKKIHEIGLIHGNIKMENILVHQGKYILTRFYESHFTQDDEELEK